MKEYQLRVKEEFEQLQEKIRKLEDFFVSGKISTLEKVDSNLLEEQILHMKDYRDILLLRIERFSK